MSELLQQWVAVAGSAMAFVTGVVVVFRRYLIPAYRLVRRHILEMQKVPAALAAQDRVLEVIRAEITPNGGGSINDAVRRIERLAIRGNYKSGLYIDSLGVGMYECDASGACIWTNRTLQKMFGLSAEAMLRDGWLRGVHVEDFDGVNDRWRDSVESRLPYKHVYRIANQTTGDVVLVETAADAVYDQAGRVIGYMGTVKPVAKPATI